jgi:Zn-dependent protease with chaperone function
MKKAENAVNKHPDLTKPAVAYKWRVWLAMISLLVFMVIYLALAAWFGWTAYRLFSDEYITFADGVIGGFSAFLAAFLLKAIFFKQRERASNGLEVTEKSHPQLFSFLNSIADQAHAPRPKRVFLSPLVNARVFYDLSVLNLVFPSRKNLEIGLGLVNVLTVSELKAVLAHEFGHFSQRSMAIGIWVYVAQQIASHIVYKRDAWDRFIKGISSIHIYTIWIGWLLSLIVWSIRSLMDSLFRLVIIAQGSLSRQMEFHADLVAVSITGSDELIHALYKLQTADGAWDRAASFAYTELSAGRAIPDIFDIQQLLIDKFAFIVDDPDYGKVPALPSEHRAAHRVFKNDFVQPPRMWASHPSNIAREENAKRHYLPSQHDERSAWLLFENPLELREQVTTKILAKASEVDVVAREQSATALNENYALLKFDPRYRGAYLNRALTRHVLTAKQLYDNVSSIPNISAALLALYPPELKDQLNAMHGFEAELANLQALNADIKNTSTGKIIFRGNEISRKELKSTIQQVQQELNSAENIIFAHDKQCRMAHLKAAEHIGMGWREYLIGLIEVLHFSEHNLFNLQDSYAKLRHVVAVVTADKKVTSKEMGYVLSAANELYDILDFIFEKSQDIKLDETLCNRMQLPAWSAAFEEFKLTGAVKENIGDWLNIIDGWVNCAYYPLSRLAHESLELLLNTEMYVTGCFLGQHATEPAPTASFVPNNYQVQLAGTERNYLKPSLLDRLYMGDGWFFGFTRLAMAVCMVAGVVIYGNAVGLETTLSIYNGLSRPVQVRLPNASITLQPFSATTLETELGKTPSIETSTLQNQLIEYFQPELAGHGRHYVYNVAGASPLYQETIGYGVEVANPLQKLGIPRWVTYSADYFFETPPSSIKSKSGKETRTLISNIPVDLSSDSALAQLRDMKLMSDLELKRIILIRAQWDVAHADVWKNRAKALVSDADTKAILANIAQQQQKPLAPPEPVEQGVLIIASEKIRNLVSELIKKFDSNSSAEPNIPSAL